MILRIENLKEVCNSILFAVDASDISEITETLELITKDRYLYMNVTNREYYVQVKIDINETIDFHATVKANVFLKLISQVTTDVVELNIVDDCLVVKANGTYKLPMIYDNDKLLELPVIEINNVTNNFIVGRDILNSILKYNTKEFLKASAPKMVVPTQRMYYIDNEGCITFTSGACVNTFTLDSSVKLLFNQRLVKLFKLFKDETINVIVGYDPVTDEFIQTKISFETSNIKITSILNCNDALLNQVPVAKIRGTANDIYNYSITIDKDSLLRTINRLMLFNNSVTAKTKTFINCKVDKSSITISDYFDNSCEVLHFCNEIDIDEPYEMILDMIDVKAVLDNCAEEYINIDFGNHKAVVISRLNIKNVIPECHD